LRPYFVQNKYVPHTNNSSPPPEDQQPPGGAPQFRNMRYMIIYLYNSSHSSTMMMIDTLCFSERP